MNEDDYGLLSEKLYAEIDRLMVQATFVFGAEKTNILLRAERLSKARTQIVNIIKEWE